MKVSRKIFATLAILVTVILGLLLWENWIWWFLPRSASEHMSGLKLPQNSKLILSSEDFGFTVYVWKVDTQYLKTLHPPADSSKLFNNKIQWKPGTVQKQDSLLPPSGILPPGSEMLSYQAKLYDVILERNIERGILKISGFYTN